MLSEWGFDYKTTGNFSHVNLPRNKKGWMRLIPLFDSREKTVPIDERSPYINYDEFFQNVTDFLAAYEARRESTTKRESGIHQLTEETRRLWDMLSAFAIMLVVKKFNGHIVPDLQNWGFQVRASRTKKKMPSTSTTTTTNHTGATSGEEPGMA
jgi:hypothetical protein